MLIFSILSLFPDVINGYSQSSIIGRAIRNQLIRVDCVNPRDFSENPHRKVDEPPFGGGGGMVMTCQPVEAAYHSLLPLKPNVRVLLMSPEGRQWHHGMAQELSQTDQIVLISGHYEGIDERIHAVIPVIETVSIGDFVLTGGELPALCILDAVSRQIPGVVQQASSVEQDSFYEGLLDTPHYTRPALYNELPVPEVLLSGDHKRINEWRRQAALERTARLRPDLLETAPLTPADHEFLQHGIITWRNQYPE